VKRSAIATAVILFVVLGCSRSPAQAVCSVSSGGVAFGTYDSIGSQVRDTNATITVECSGTVGAAVNYTIALASGGGTISDRRVTYSTTHLSYNLYTDASRNQIWGDGTSGSTTVGDSYTLDAPVVSRNYTVYGRVAAGQSGAIAGSYTDSVQMVLNY
jgi:spore coat protein U-like protein